MFISKAWPQLFFLPKKFKVVFKNFQRPDDIKQ